MERMRVWQLAKLVNGLSNPVLRRLQRVGYDVKTPASAIEVAPIEKDALVAWLSGEDVGL